MIKMDIFETTHYASVFVKQKKKKQQQLHVPLKSVFSIPPTNAKVEKNKGYLTFNSRDYVLINKIQLSCNYFYYMFPL